MDVGIKVLQWWVIYILFFCAPMNDTFYRGNNNNIIINTYDKQHNILF